MFDNDLDKYQDDLPPSPDSQPPGVIISQDTRRANRVPPGQSRTRKWPVLDAAGPPRIDLSHWRLDIDGLVPNKISLTWDQLTQLPQIQVFADFHCVTRWSRLGNLWQGVSTRTLLELAGGPNPNAHFALIHAYDFGWTTNLPLDALLAPDALVATHHDGQPLSPEHGAPARLIIPHLYAWKSAKWIGGIELIEHDKAGFWERNGYHMNGDPWQEERFGGWS
ncbi:MAG TPA: sulfite oxidase-like oxidoreductase [Bryobacteraceae bacterium]|nr:sulfite oxidase-like oxidoreductase [Bryobacteraceae bacterium]